MENLNDESLRKLFKESGSRAIDNEPDIWFTRRAPSFFNTRPDSVGSVYCGMYSGFWRICRLRQAIYADTRFAYAYRGFRVSGCRGFRYRVADVPVATSLQVSVFIEKSLLYNCARGFFDGETYHSQPRTTSRIIIRANPMANPMVPVLLCFPVALSGISSSTTT